MTIAQILEEIDRASEHCRMSKREALEFLETITMEIESRTEALREELRPSDDR